MTSTARVQKSREKAAKLGLRRKEYMVSDFEHVKIRELLKALRQKNKKWGDI